MTARLRVGLIGAGAIGRIHALNLASRIPEAELAAVADVDADAAHAIAGRFDVDRVYHDHLELLADPAVDAVAVCTPRATHATMIRLAASEGKHVFCEKPPARSLAEADEAFAAVARAGVKLQVGFNRRFDASFRHVRETVEAGRIGEPRIVHIVSRDPAVPGYTPSAEDVFLETTVHDFDIARYLTGAEAGVVYTVGLRGSRPETFEGAITTLTFANGVVATIDNHLRSAYGYDQRVEVFGSNGAIATANETPYRATLSDATGLHEPLPLPFFAERYAESYVAEMSAFARCVLEDTEPPVTGSDGRAALVLSLAALDSLRRGRPVNVSG